MVNLDRLTFEKTSAIIRNTDAGNSANTVAAAITDIAFVGNGRNKLINTNLTSAIRLVRTQLINPARQATFVMVFTDGQIGQEFYQPDLGLAHYVLVEELAIHSEWQASNVVRFALQIGDSTNSAVLDTLASTPEHVHRVGRKQVWPCFVYFLSTDPVHHCHHSATSLPVAHPILSIRWVNCFNVFFLG